MQKLLTMDEVLEEKFISRGWLYLREEKPTLSSVGFFYNADLSLSPDEEKLIRAEFVKKGWKPTLSAEDIHDVISNLAEQLDGDSTKEQRLVAFQFFLDNDASIEA